MRPLLPSFPRLRRLVLSAGIVLLFACGPENFDLNEFTSYFLPESATALKADFRYEYTLELYKYESSQEYYEDVGASTSGDENIRAWRTYLRDALPDTLINATLASTDPFVENALTRHLTRHNPAALAYLRLALSADKALNVGEPWNALQDSSAAQNLLTEARNRLPAIQDSFLKERYAFQAVKLSAQLGDYEQARALYKQVVQRLRRKTFISDWSRCRHAAVLLETGDTAHAAFEFAQVFDRCPSRRREAELSLRINGIGFRPQALALAKTDGERAAVYALAAIQPRVDALPYLEKLVEIAPKNPLVELILAREINKNELFLNDSPEFYTYDEAGKRDSARFEAHRREAPSYTQQLNRFARRAAENPDLPNPAFYLTAAAYLDYLEKDFATASKTLDKAIQTPTSNPGLKKQIAVQQLLLLAVQPGAVTPEVETKLIESLERFGNSTNFRLNNAFVKACQLFAKKYGQRDERPGGWLSSCQKKALVFQPTDWAKAYVLQSLTAYQLNRKGAYFATNTNLSTIEDSTSAAGARWLLAYAHRPDASDFDRRLLRLAGFDENHLQNLLGRRALAEGRFSEAAEAFGHVERSEWKQERYQTCFEEDPFVLPPRQVNKKRNPYTPAQFAARLATLQERAERATGDAAADLYFQLASGVYNLSWHGNSWVMVRRYWSSQEYLTPPESRFGWAIPQPEKKSLSYSPLDDSYYSNARARQFFDLSLKAARDPERAARAGYFLALCDRNAYELATNYADFRRNSSGKELGQNSFVIPWWNAYQASLRRIAERYRDTQFAQQTLGECPPYTQILAGK